MGRKKNQALGPSGLLAVDKPQGLTSHDVVSRLRRLAGTRRVGHAGTLDPMATGLLIIGVNQATKLLTWLVGESKTYSGTIRLGQSTVTDDAEGEITATAPEGVVEGITTAALEKAVAALTGDISQVPSAVSAIKVDGRRSYARVRSGEEVRLAARPVRISRFEVQQIHLQPLPGGGPRVMDLEVSVSCSSGTYIRALARDLGAALGVGGHLTRLRREAIGEVGLQDALSLEDLAAAREAGKPLPLLGINDVAARLFTTRQLSAEEASDLSHGRWIQPSAPTAEGTQHSEAAGAQEGGVVPAELLTAAFAPDGTLVALTEDQRRRGRLHAVPHLVFASGRRFQDPDEQDAPDVPRASDARGEPR